MGRLSTGSISFLIITSMALLTAATAETHIVGGRGLGWSVPVGGSVVYQTWAATHHFEVGDTLEFNWNSVHTVAEVSKADYDSCTTTNPINGAIQQTSPVTITLDANGTRYFICTVNTHCQLGQKVTINVGSSTSAVSSLTVCALSAFLSTISISFLM